MLYQWILFICTLAVLFGLAWQKPVWLIGLLAAAAALEISIMIYPEMGVVGTLLGEVSLAKLTSFTLILAAFCRFATNDEYRRKLKQALWQPLTVTLLIYILIGALSVIYSAAPARTLVETVRLLTLLFVLFAIVLLMEKKHMLLPFYAVHTAALLLAPLSFYEGFVGRTIWQWEHLRAEPVLRVNASFVDPNIFARYLILAIVANFVLQIYTENKQARLLYMAALPVLLAQLILTSSRAGLLILIVMLVAALFFLPNKRAPLCCLGLGAAGALVAVLSRPEIISRFTSIFSFHMETANPVRSYLWKVGIEIFKDHPVLGTGLGSFQTVFQTEYKDFQTVHDGATLSHTTLLTIASELGVVGLAAVFLLAMAMFWTLFKLYEKGSYYVGMFYDYNNVYYKGWGYVLWIGTIFISSQSEGRLFEDPLLWLAFACLLVMSIREQKVW